MRDVLTLSLLYVYRVYPGPSITTNDLKWEYQWNLSDKIFYSKILKGEILALLHLSLFFEIRCFHGDG
jgi:hypothetical protein